VFAEQPQTQPKQSIRGGAPPSAARHAFANSIVAVALQAVRRSLTGVDKRAKLGVTLISKETTLNVILPRMAPVHGHPQASAAACAPGAALPLSWDRLDVPMAQFQAIPLPLSRLTWIPQATLAQHHSFAELFADLSAQADNGILVRGCSPELAACVVAHGGSSVRVGIEALIDLHGEGLLRRSVQKMVRQARRHGAVHELPWSAESALALRDLARTASHGGRPQLRHLFRTSFDPHMRAFVFCGNNGEWHGALLLSLAGSHLAVTELMLRRPDAPGGVMESLFVAAGMQLRAEGVRMLSLNEVPFHHLSDDLQPFERLIGYAGRTLLQNYNAAGLMRFKSKFHPHWRPVYLCSNRPLSVLALTDMFVASGCLHLAGHGVAQWVLPGSARLLVRRLVGGTAG
jgi:hypothetical protein